MTELPSGWVTAPLSEITFINPGIDKSKIKADAKVNFVAMPAVEAESGRIDITEVRAFARMKTGYTPFLEGDVLFAKITPCMENGKMAVVPKLEHGYGFGSTEFHVLRCPEGVEPKYIYFFVSGERFRRDAEHKMTGAVGQKRVPEAFLQNEPCPLPPTNEQRRIVEKIETLFADLDAGVESLTRARARLALYRQSVLKAAFEGRLTADWRAEHSAEWPLEHLGDHLSFVTSGSRGWAKYYSDSGDTFVRAQNLKHDRLDLADIAYVTLPKGKTEGVRTRILEGDVLVTITGANVTKTAPVLSDLGTAYVSQHVALCRPRDTLDTKYLHWFLVAEAAGRKQLTDAAYGAGKPGLNLQNIKDVVIPVPEKGEQWEIIRRLEATLSNIDALEAQIDDGHARAKALRQSILKRAFAGQLVAQDPNDEPAYVLLERIKAEKAAGPKTKRQRKANA